VHLSIRLLVPQGSLLLGDPELGAGLFDPAALGHPWRHPDPRMDHLQHRVARAVEEDAAGHRRAEETFDRVRQLALAAAGRWHRHVAANRPPGAPAPRLTESWFC
jgi:hypothetical protein